MQLSQLPQGTYVVGVSGGVDSVVLLHTLVKTQPQNCYIVAHFNHGIRGEVSQRDAEFVSQLAGSYGLEFELGQGELGQHASEDTARTARYDFLRQCRDKHKASAIIVAHHQDDILETMLINVVRGTGWRGLTSLRSHPSLVRPLLHVTKTQIMQYAKQNNLIWHEDATNTDTKYLRNYIRHEVLGKATDAHRQKLLSIYNNQNNLRQQIDQELNSLLEKNATSQNGTLITPRYLLIMLPKPVAIEYLQSLVNKASHARLERQQAELALVFARSAKPDKMWQPSAAVKLAVNRDTLFVEAVQS